ncbi:MAG: HU family DNA-binding protein [Acidithiobacillus ferrooxidans]
MNPFCCPALAGSHCGRSDPVARCYRPGRNFQTGESALVAARRVVTFLAGLDLRKRGNVGKDSALDER